jgi:hypothetical protein
MWIALAVLAVASIAVAVGVVATSSPAFLGGYHDYEQNYEGLQVSEHSELACDACHVDDRGALVREAALVGDFYRGLLDKPDQPVFVQMSTPPNDACLECHLWDWSEDSSRTANVPHPAHLRVANETRECVECHKWTGHEEEYIEEHKGMPFSNVCASFGCHAGTKALDECGSCHHGLQEDRGEWVEIHEETVRSYGPNACLEACHDADQCRQCHTTGVKPDFPENITGLAVQRIEREHVKPDWMEQHGTLALEDEEKCFVCHVSVGECEDCHSERPAFHGLESTWLNRHAEFAEDERRCLVCHEAEWCEECHDQFKEMR